MTSTGSEEGFKYSTVSTSLSTEIGVRWLKMGQLGQDMSMKETEGEILHLIPPTLSMKKAKNR